MKKLSICLLMIMCLFMTGCGEDEVKEVATLDEFEAAAINENLTVSSNMDKYTTVDYIIDSRKAVYDDIEIEMVKYTDGEYAVKAQDNHIESFNLLKSTGAQSIKEKGSNYYKYALISNNRYMISMRVEDTLIFSKVMLEDKETVEAIIDALGY